MRPRAELVLSLVVLCAACVCRGGGQGTVMRNRDLINRMVSHFQKDYSASRTQPAPRGAHSTNKKIMVLMQNILCKNFPTVPCSVIMQDSTLRALIERSIQQIKNKKLSLEQAPSTDAPSSRTQHPASDELNSLNVSQGTFFKKHSHRDKKQPATRGVQSGLYWSQEMSRKKMKVAKEQSMHDARGIKQMRKFYPHKIKYKDKSVKDHAKARGSYTRRQGNGEARDSSDDRRSVSAEAPGPRVPRLREDRFKVEPADPAVWRIDYTKHGDPALSFDFQDSRLSKIMRPANGDNNVLEPVQSARKGVLHPDVYIKKNNYFRLNSETLD